MAAGGRPRRLRVGRTEATWDGGGLRWIRVDGIEVLRGILLTARDADWRTLVPDIRGLVVTKGVDAFSIDFEARFRGEGLAVDARIAYRGDRDGGIEASFNGRVVADSVVQRLGLVVLHPADAAGRPFEAFDDAGEMTLRGRFPDLVSPERVPTAVRSLKWEPASGMGATLTFDGDPWETEDQRAWTDASFKSYSPPIDWPHPVELAAGAVVRHVVRLNVATKAGAHAVGSAPTGRRRAGERVVVSTVDAGPLAPIGLGWGGPIDARDAARLRELRPGHLRVVLDHAHPDWSAELDRAARDATAIGTALQLELVAFADAVARDELADALKANAGPVVGALAFGTTDDAGLVTTAGSEVGALRDRLRAVLSNLVVGGGSRVGYAELATADLPIGELERVTFAVTPQMHATDPTTIIENLSTLPVVMRSAAALSDRPVDVLCTFRPRFDGYATPPGRRLAPTRFDDRLAGDLGQVWLIGTLAGVLPAARARVTVLEASGPAGVLLTDDGRDGSGGLAVILVAIRSMGDAQVVEVETTPGCTALAIRSDDRLLVIVANLRDRPTTVRLDVPAEVGSFPDRLELGALGSQIIDLRVPRA